MLDALARTARSRAQLAQLLARKGYPDRVVEPVLDRLEGVGLVNDAALARDLVATRHGERGLSRRAVVADLVRRGIEADLAAEAAAAISADAEEEAATGLARRRLAATQGLDRAVRLRRAVGALARRGYDPHTAAEIVARELDAER